MYLSLGCIHCIDKNEIPGGKGKHNQPPGQYSSDCEHANLIPLCDAHLLFVHFGLGSPRAQVPAAATLVIPFVLDGDLGEMSKDVLHLGIAATTALAAEVVEPRNLVHQVVDDGDNDLENIHCQ